MKARTGFVVDMAQHLGGDLDRTIQRHARLIEASGASTVELAAILMIVAESVAIQAIGSVVLNSAEAQRGETFDMTVAMLARKIMARRTVIMTKVADAEAVARR